MRFILPCSFLQVEALHILQPQLLPPVCLIIQDMLRLVQNFFHIRALVLRHGVRAIGRFGKERGGSFEFSPWFPLNKWERADLPREI